MNEEELNKAVRAWLNTLPGTVEDVGAEEVARKA